MSDKPDEKEKEIDYDKLFQLIDAVARIDTKLSSFDRLEKEIQEIIAAQYLVDSTETRRRLALLDQEILDDEKRKNEIMQTAADLQRSFDKWKIYYSLIAFVGAPIVTTTIIYIITRVLGNIF